MLVGANAILNYIGTHVIGNIVGVPKVVAGPITKDDTSSTWDENLVWNLLQSTIAEKVLSIHSA